MDSSISKRERTDFQNVLWLFFGGSFIGYTLISIDVQSHGLTALILSFFGSTALFVAFKDHKRQTLITVAVFGLLILILIIGQMAGEGLAILATVGVYGPDRSSQSYLYAENYIIIAMIWLLLGVPHRAFMYRLDLNGEGDAQRVVVKILVTSSSLMTGAYILLLHFDDGPLHEVSMRALIPGIITTILLIMPAYRFVAKLCWQRGIKRLFFPKVSTESWVNALTELDDAFYQAAKRFIARKKLKEASTNTSHSNHASRGLISEQRSNDSSLRQNSKHEINENPVNRSSGNLVSSPGLSGGSGSSPRQSPKRRTKKIRGKNAAQRRASGQKRGTGIELGVRGGEMVPGFPAAVRFAPPGSAATATTATGSWSARSAPPRPSTATPPASCH